MKGIITVIGKDRVGIIARICTFLSENAVNILDISQSIVGGYFNMLMIVDASECSVKFEDLVSQLADLGDKIGVKIKLQHEEIFNSMHRI